MNGIKEIIPLAKNLTSLYVAIGKIKIDIDDYNTILEMIKRRHENKQIVITIYGHKKHFKVPEDMIKANERYLKLISCDDDDDDDSDDDEYDDSEYDEYDDYDYDDYDDDDSYYYDMSSNFDSDFDVDVVEEFLNYVGIMQNFVQWSNNNQ